MSDGVKLIALPVVNMSVLLTGSHVSVAVYSDLVRKITLDPFTFFEMLITARVADDYVISGCGNKSGEAFHYPLAFGLLFHKLIEPLHERNPVLRLVACQ